MRIQQSIMLSSLLRFSCGIETNRIYEGKFEGFSRVKNLNISSMHNNYNNTSHYQVIYCIRKTNYHFWLHWIRTYHKTWCKTVDSESKTHSLNVHRICIIGLMLISDII